MKETEFRQFRNSVQQRVLIKDPRYHESLEKQPSLYKLYIYTHTHTHTVALTLKIVATAFYLRVGLCTFNSFLMPRTSGYSRALTKLSQCAEHKVGKNNH